MQSFLRMLAALRIGSISLNYFARATYEIVNRDITVLQEVMEFIPGYTVEEISCSSSPEAGVFADEPFQFPVKLRVGGIQKRRKGFAFKSQLRVRPVIREAKDLLTSTFKRPSLVCPDPSLPRISHAGSKR